jgi:8-oxo-dGTP pyrophosphatase MutT (NUDIX family)
MHSLAVGAAAKNVVDVQVLNVRSLGARRRAKSVRLSDLRRLKQWEKVAAVCYRIRPSGIQFLLVQTRRGRWTFPKGHVEPGLTHAQAAALEAFEEAGVHGRMQEAPFTHYTLPKNGNSAPIRVSAHLCQVSRLESPPEPGRNRTWFPPEGAKQRLREGRKSDSGAQLLRVVDRAVAHILRLQSYDSRQQKVRLKMTCIEGVPGSPVGATFADPNQQPDLIRAGQRRLLPGGNL